LLQLERPLPQVKVQAPAEHTCPPVQVTPQAPQFAGSAEMSVQTPRQRMPLS
jgi:hypothetical protein